jgi:hypothetical protein
MGMAMTRTLTDSQLEIVKSGERYAAPVGTGCISPGFGLRVGTLPTTAV